MKSNAIHYRASDKPLGSVLLGGDDSEETCLSVSAGHQKHEYTTGTSWPQIRRFFDPVAPTDAMKDDELISYALEKKDEGNLKFKAQELEAAETLYADALTNLEMVEDKTAEDFKKVTVILN